MSEQRDDAGEGPPATEARLPHLRAFAIAFGTLNALAAAAAIFGAIVYIGEAQDRRLQRDTFEALTIEMLFSRLDRARGTGSDSSDVLQRLNAFGVRVRDINLTDLIFIEPPSRLDPVVLLHGERYFIACPFGDDAAIGVEGGGRVMSCDGVRGIEVDIRNPVRLEFTTPRLIGPTFYCRTGSSLAFSGGSLEQPTFHCKREQVAFLRGAAEPADARWCHPDDDPPEIRRGAPPLYASGPCAGEIYPNLNQIQDPGAASAS